MGNIISRWRGEQPKEKWILDKYESEIDYAGAKVVQTGKRYASPQKRVGEETFRILSEDDNKGMVDPWPKSTPQERMQRMHESDIKRIYGSATVRLEDPWQQAQLPYNSKFNPKNNEKKMSQTVRSSDFK